MERPRRDTREDQRGWRKLYQALDERLGLSAFQYPVPPHANTLRYSLGGVTLISFLILVATGFLLAQFYNPLPEAANESTRYISHGSPGTHHPRRPLLGGAGDDFRGQPPSPAGAHQRSVQAPP